MNSKNVCKYCHLEGHVIDSCPTIICKICKEIGHAQWLCTKKTKNKTVAYTPPINNTQNNVSNNYNYNSNNNNYNYQIEKNNSNTVQKDINYYNNLNIDLNNKSWGDLIELN
jgi:hypothetical protein